MPSRTVPTPSELDAFRGVGFRDVQLSKSYGVAIDAAGDVVQWGAGYDSDAPQPHKTLTGLDLVKVQPCGAKIYALSRSGYVYVFPSERTKQRILSSWTGSNVEHVQLTAMDPATRRSGERFVDIAGGAHHLVALGRTGGVWTVPVDHLANEYGQLGYSSVSLSSGETRLEPRIVSNNAANDSTLDTSIRYATQLRPVPSLSGVAFSEIAAGTAHSVVRTADGRVLTWGCNTHGQLGLGRITCDTIAVPTEVAWPAPVVGRSARCTKIAAGGATTLFVIYSRGAPTPTDDDTPRRPVAGERIDVLAAGSGQRGSLGNGQRSQTCGIPVRVKAISGLQEYSEAKRSMQPIDVHALTVGDEGQCAATMTAPAIDTEIRRDVYVWGANDANQLGLGRKGNLAAPTLLALPVDAEKTRDSPVLNRVLLVERRERAKTFDESGHGSTRNGTVAQTVVAGGDNMAVFGHIM